MIDRILEEGGDRVVAIKNVTINEPFFQGHFPDPLGAVMPGTLIIESMVQAASFLASTGSSAGEASEGYLVGVQKARFRRKVVPGDQLRIEVRLIRQKRGLMQAEATASVDGEAAATAIVSLLLPDGRRKPDQ